MSVYRKIWKNHYGDIPKDSNGRIFEIHHIDGNRNNNDISNLTCVSIEEHYQIHLNQGDYGAASLIAKRMGLPTNYISKLQTGKKRPGLVGKSGPKKGNIPWNKNVKGYKLNTNRKGKRFSAKLTIDDVRYIRDCYESNIPLSNSQYIGTIGKNGTLITYKIQFIKEYAEKYNVTTTAMNKIINYNTWKDGIIDARSKTKS